MRDSEIKAIVDRYLDERLKLSNDSPGEFEVVGWIEEKERNGLRIDPAEKLLLKTYRRFVK